VASIQEIGQAFGGRHHTTVLHSIRRIETMLSSDKAMNRAITRLINASCPADSTVGRIQ
jgi:chromosomal replication initiator protein